MPELSGPPPLTLFARVSAWPKHRAISFTNLCPWGSSRAQCAVVAFMLRAAPLLSLAGIVLPAQAQPWPSRQIKIVSPSSPGGGIDIVARIVAEKLGAALGQQVLVENRPGAGGRLGTEFVARAAPDGYTLLAGSGGTLIAAPALYPKLAYAPLRDFAPISLTATTAYLLLVHPSVPARSVKELVALARGRPGRLNYASTGAGSPANMGSELFNVMAGTRMLHVPYKGSVPGTLSVMQGETDMMFNNFLTALPLVKAGRLRALAVSSLQRSAVVPELPTVDEAGLRGFELQQFYSLLAPAGTSPEIVARLNREIVARLPAADTRERLAADGTEVSTSTPAELGRLLAAQITKWSALVTRAGITGE